MSTTFYPGANLHPSPPDVVLLSSDTVFFYVHSAVLLRESSTQFNALLPAPAELAARDKDIRALPELYRLANIDRQPPTFPGQSPADRIADTEAARRPPRALRCGGTRPAWRARRCGRCPWRDP